VDVLRARIRVVETVVKLNGALVADTPKSAKSRRAVPVPPTLARQVSDHIAARRLGPENYVFANEDGSPFDHERFYQYVFCAAVKATGLGPLRFHDLRHTYASLMHAQGRSMLEVSRWMGHSTYRLTADTYSHLWDDEDAGLGQALDAAFAAAEGPLSSDHEHPRAFHLLGASANV
jgi:integrase